MNTSVYAGFWRRTFAFIVDLVLINLLPALVFIPILIGLATQATSPEVGFAAMAIILAWNLAFLIIFWLYFALLESSSRQATVGKMLLGIKVVDKAGNRIGFAHATGRTFAKIISYLSMYIGFLMAGFTSRKRALHDYIANTYVVSKHYQPGEELPDTPSHIKWLVGLLVLLAVALGGVIYLSLATDSGKALRAASNLQTLYYSEDTLNYGTIEQDGVSYSYSPDGFRASFAGRSGQGQYVLYLEGEDAGICCAATPRGNTCEDIGFEPCL